MSQNIYDDPEFFAGYSQLRRQVHGLDGAPEWPAVRAMLPDLSGKRVADLGCGFGWAARWMREQGAASVLGIDLSRNMIERARAQTTDPAIEYRIADLETVELPENTFDVVYSSLAFHYVEDYGRLIDTISRSLVPGGQLTFTIEHPILTAATYPKWTVDEASRKSWPVNSYSYEGERKKGWFVDDVITYHRTLGTTLNTLIGAGLQLRRVEEFAPTQGMLQERPELADELERPTFLLVSAGT